MGSSITNSFIADAVKPRLERSDADLLGSPITENATVIEEGS